MKFMNMKRFGSVVMAGALALSLTAPAFADDPTTTIEGGFEPITIAVSVPSTGEAQINPYGLPVNITKSDTITNVPIIGQKITSKPLSIKNEGETDLAVNASFKAIPKANSNVSIKGGALTTTGASADKGKQINLMLEVVGLDNDDYKVSSLDTTLDDKLIDAFAASATWANAKSLTAKAAADSTATPAFTKSSDSGECGVMAKLGKSTVAAGGLVTYGADSIALFRLTGDLLENPVKTESGADVDDPWVETDGFTATVVFKFTPYKNATLTLDKTTLALKNPVASGTANTNKDTLTATFTAGDSGLTVTGQQWTVEPSTGTGTATGYTFSTPTALTTDVTASAGTSTTASVTVKCTATLSDGSTMEATCAVTYADT